MTTFELQNAAYITDTLSLMFPIFAFFGEHGQPEPKLGFYAKDRESGGRTWTQNMLWFEVEDDDFAVLLRARFDNLQVMSRN